MLQVTSKTNDYLKLLSKTVENNSPRNYGEVIGISKKRAVSTNGFALMYFSADDLPEDEKTITKDLTRESSVKFPKFDAVIPQGSLKDFDGDSFFKLAKALTTAKTKLFNIWFKLSNGSISIVSNEQSDLNLISDTYFNASIVVNYIKGLPKDSLVTEAKVSEDNIAIIKFNTSHVLVFVGLKKNDY